MRCTCQPADHPDHYVQNVHTYHDNGEYVAEWTCRTCTNQWTESYTTLRALEDALGAVPPEPAQFVAAED